MAVEQLANLAQTTLATTITAGATSLVVSSATGFPSSGNFRITVTDGTNTEIMLVTAVSGTTFTVTRQNEDSARFPAYAFTAGAIIRCTYTAGAHNALLGDEMYTATYANRLAAAKAARIFLPSDGVYMERDTGAAWAQWGPLYPFTAPVSGDFSWVNQGSSTVTTTYGGVFLYVPNAGAAQQIRGRFKTNPTVPYVITAYISPLIFAKQYHGFGLAFRQTSDGKLHTFGYEGAGTSFDMQSTKWTDTATQSAHYSAATAGSVFPWLRIADDNTNRICSYSCDGRNWLTFHSVGRTDFLTANQVGFYCRANNNATPNLDVGMNLLSWVEG